ncbi:MAG: hypothetical protein KAX49_13935 [Halanaerobiales bacterium]|nr:hypothetical protein [Halanaerobiales bacterium]
MLERESAYGRSGFALQFMRHDDRIEVLAIAVNYWVNFMARDEEIALEAYHGAQLQTELKVFMDNVLGNNASGGSSDIKNSI